MFHLFLLCSGLAAVVNLAVGYLLYGVLGLNGPVSYAFSVSLAFISGMAVSFVLNRRYTYGASGRGTRLEMRDFFGVSLGGLTLTTGIAHLLNSGAAAQLTQISFGLLRPETLAHICAVGLTAIYSFLAHKHISFRKVGPGRGGDAGWQEPLEHAGRNLK